MFTTAGTQALCCHSPPCSSEKSTLIDFLRSNEFWVDAPISMPWSVPRYFVARRDGCMRGHLSSGSATYAGGSASGRMK